jgi:hypothetical protein
VRFRIFSCSAYLAIEVSRIAAPVKYIAEELESIAATIPQPKSHQVSQVNAPEQQRKEIDVKTKLLAQMGAVIYTNF